MSTRDWTQNHLKIKNKKAYNEYSQSANEGLSRELAREKEREREGETGTGQRHQIEHSWVPGARQPEHRFLYFLSLSSLVFSFVFPTVLCFYNLFIF